MRAVFASRLFRRHDIRHPVLRRVAARLAFLPVALFVLITIAFFIVNVAPSNPAAVVLGSLSTPQQQAQFNRAHGLDGSVWTRYVHYLGHVLHGSLGHSYYDGTAVRSALWGHLTSTLELVVLAFLLAWTLGTILGVLSAYFRGSWIDGLVRAVVSVVQSVPDFVIGLLGASLLAFGLKLLPAPLGQLPVTITPPSSITGADLVDALLHGDFSVAWAAFQQAILPVLALGIFNSVVFARTVRATMVEALDSPYIQFARSRGLKERTIVWLALRSCLVPTITYSGVVVASLLSGTAVVETAFSWQGMGQWAVQGILRSDLPVAEGFVLVSGVFVVLVYLVSDLLTLAVDPRLRAPATRGVTLGGAFNEPALVVADSLQGESQTSMPVAVPDEMALPSHSLLGPEPVLADAVAGGPSEPPTRWQTVGAADSVVLWPSHAPSRSDPPTLWAEQARERSAVEVAGVALLAGHGEEPVPEAAQAAHRRSLLRRWVAGGHLQVGIGLGVVILFLLASFFAPLPFNPSHPYPQYTLVHPGSKFWLGTDSNGYDVLSRVVVAARNDIPIGLAGALIGALIGTPLGLVVGRPGRRSEAVMRLVDLVQSLPVVLVAVVLAATSRGGSTGVIAAIALVNAPIFIRIVRAGALTVRNRRFVEAAQAMGASPLRISVRHILPNLVDLILAQLSISIGFAILAIAALSYLGAGLSLTTATWGGMINQGSKVLGVGDWWTVAVPAFAIALTVFSFNLVADGLQRVFSIGGKSR